MTTPKIANVMAQKIQFNTFGGNPVCSAGGLAVLRVIDKEKRQEHCANVGSHLIGRLRALQKRHESNFLQTWHLKQISHFPLIKRDKGKVVCSCIEYSLV